MLLIEVLCLFQYFILIELYSKLINNKLLAQPTFENKQLLFVKIISQYTMNLQIILPYWVLIS